MKITIAEERVPVLKGSFGLSLDDVNYAFDGGLYAEILENRDFEAKDVTLEDGRYAVAPGGGYAWQPYPDAASCALKVKTDRPLYAENPHYLRIEAAQDGAGVSNKAYDGVTLKKGTEYLISFYLRSYDYKGLAFVGVYGESALLEKKFKVKPDGKWHRHSFKLKSKWDATGAQFRLTLKRAGNVHVDCFSMMPAYAVLGCLRRDLVERMKELKPGYLRFAGNCGRGANRASWKDSVGDAERRLHNWNVWAAHAKEFSHYGKTNGLGIFECLKLAEYLSASPVPILDMGTSSDAAEDFETFVQDALDLIEFTSGGTDTMWGKLRAELGHPAAFRLEMLEVGYVATETVKAVRERFEKFALRIHEKYPDIELIPPQRPLFLRPAALLHNVSLYDEMPRDTAVSISEFAARGKSAGENPAENRWEGALAEAAFLTGVERNGDIVAMKSYAPLFARLGYTQWSPALVWFDGVSSYGSASYYVQMLYSQYTGDVALPAQTDAEFTYAVASEREGVTFVKVVNASARELEAEIAAEHDFGELARVIRMAGEPEAYNTLAEPELIAPRDVAPTAPRSAVLPPYSFSVLVFRK